MSANNKTQIVRQQIIHSSDELLYKKGFNLMSFTDIAEASNVPRGNIYYHFKTKDDVLRAVIESRIESMQQMLTEWEQTISDPLLRLKRFAQIAINEQHRVTQLGCPIGTLNAELGKTQSALQKLAKQQMDIFQHWLVQQFAQLNIKQSPTKLAEQLLIRTQGASMLAHIYQDVKIIQREVSAIDAWLDHFII